MKKDINVFAYSLKEAQKKLEAQIPTGFFLISLEKHESQKLSKKAYANTTDEAFSMIENKIPKKVISINKKILKEASIKKVEEYAYNEADIYATSHTMFDDTEAEIKEISLTTKGSNGVFGIGKKPSIFLVEILYKALVEIDYETFVKIDATITDDIQKASIAFVYAAEDGNFSFVKSILDQGIDINSVDEKGANALMLAAFNGHHKLALYLIENNIDVQSRDQGGFDALMLACETQKPNTNLVNKIIDKGVNVNAKSNRDSTALMAAAKSGHLELVKLLFANGANLDDANLDHNITPLIWAANEGHLPIVKYLLEKGADKNILTHNNYTAGTIAKENAHYDIVDVLNQY